MAIEAVLTYLQDVLDAINDMGSLIQNLKQV